MSEDIVPDHIREFMARARIHVKLWSARLDRFYSIAHAAGLPDEEITALAFDMTSAWLLSQGPAGDKVWNDLMRLRFPFTPSEGSR